MKTLSSDVKILLKRLIIVIQNAFVYGMWLSRAFDRFQEEMRLNRVSGSFDNWVN